MERSTAVAPHVRLLGAAAATGLAAYTGHSLLGLAPVALHGFFEDWVYNALLLTAALLCLLRAASGHAERMPWALLGAGLLVWSLGGVVHTLDPTLLAEGSFPTVVDALWLGFYPLAYVALLLLVRARAQRFHASLWLDGVLGGLAVAAIAAAFAFPPLVRSTGGSTADIVASLSYPVADLVLVAMVVWVLAITGWRPGRTLGFVATGFALAALADGFSLLWAATGHLTDRTALDWLWPASALMLAYAAWQPLVPSPPLQLTGLRILAYPLVFALAALGLLAVGAFMPVERVGLMLAAGALLVVLVRLALTFTENLRMMEQSRRESLTDALTGLGNRRKLMLDLQAELRAASDKSPRTLLVFDLDGFKRYNDTFGHPAGDALLAQLGGKLRTAVGGGGRAYRLGGDEFCALVPGGRRDLRSLVDVTCGALYEQGKGFTVTTSCGAVVLPEEAEELSLALQLADERLYGNKGLRRREFQAQQVRDVLMQALHEREPNLHEHVDGVASLAVPVGRRFGLSSDQLDEVARAAELHDVGKMAVPDSILTKEDPLDEVEAALVQQHTVVGERILSAAPALKPVGRLVRSSHEWYDGRGYPDGLGGEKIPLGSRIIAVCDAYHAMITGRPYQSAVGSEAAIAELRRCSGSQFDPEVVQVFCEELAAGRLGDVLVEPREAAAA